MKRRNFAFAAAAALGAPAILRQRAAAQSMAASVRLNWYLGGSHGAYVLGKERGFYAEEGINLTINEGRGSVRSVQLIGSKEDDFAMADAGSLMLGASRGIPAKAVMTVVGVSSFCVVARKDSGITSIETAKGKTFAFADPNSTSGYLVPAAELTATYGKLEEFFSEVKMSGGHEQTIVGVSAGDFASGVSWADGLGNWEDGYTNGAFRKAADAGLVDMSDLVEIWRSKLIPNGPYVVRASLPTDVKDTVTAMVADMWETDKECAYALAAGDAKDFIPVTHADFEGVIAARKLQEGM
jgi:phosphate/phosphite/phosphonate ABC transporter binding protein